MSNKAKDRSDFAQAVYFALGGLLLLLLGLAVAAYVRGPDESGMVYEGFN